MRVYSRMVLRVGTCSRACAAERAPKANSSRTHTTLRSPSSTAVSSSPPTATSLASRACGIAIRWHEGARSPVSGSDRLRVRAPLMPIAKMLLPPWKVGRTRENAAPISKVGGVRYVSMVQTDAWVPGPAVTAARKSRAIPRHVCAAALRGPDDARRERGHHSARAHRRLDRHALEEYAAPTRFPICPLYVGGWSISAYDARARHQPSDGGHASHAASALRKPSTRARRARP
jgi:hypothetical protein